MISRKKLLFPMIVRFVMFPVLLGLLVLLPAGTMRFWQVYVYFAALMTALVPVMSYFYRKNPEFLERRMKTGEKDRAQKIFVLLSAISIIGAFVVPGFDFRFKWSSISLWFCLGADVLVVLSYLFIFLVFKANSYASRVVEVAEGQTVISNGPYAWVRHPMYSGMFVLYMATPVALGSWWGLVPASLLLPLLVFRIMNEERMLREELDGYSEYCRKVKYRLVPGLW